MDVKIGISSRHIHLSKEDLYELFGENYKLNKLKDLSQDNNYSCVETVDIENEGNIIKNVRVVGPVRDKTQAEISKTDSYLLKINPPVRNSGDLSDASLITIIGPKGKIKRNCCIIATRHIHISMDEAKKLNYKNFDIVNVKLNSIKGGIINNVYIKYSKTENCELHLDLDDANAHLINNNDIAQIMEVEDE